jgi:hypothetical protein
MQEDPVAQVAQRPPRGGVHLGFVKEHAAHRVGIDLDWHVHTIAGKTEAPEAA